MRSRALLFFVILAFTPPVYAGWESLIVEGVNTLSRAAQSKADEAKTRAQQQAQQQQMQVQLAEIQRQQAAQQALMQAAQKFAQEYPTANPQPWQTELNNVNLATGEKIYEKPFEHIYTAAITAISNMGMKVESIEKQSGLINASGNPLPSDLRNALNNQKAIDFVKLEGLDPAILNTAWVANAIGNRDMGLTVRFLKQDFRKVRFNIRGLPWSFFGVLNLEHKELTKVKLRITRESYPAIATEVYQIVWREIDKQIFLDSNLDV